MDNRGGVVLSVYSVENRVVYNAFSKVAVLVREPYALLNGFLEISVNNDLVAVLDKQHRHTRILTHRDFLLGGDSIIFDNLGKYAFSGVAILVIARPFESGQYIVSNKIIAVHKQLFYRGCYIFGLNNSRFHILLL